MITTEQIIFCEHCDQPHLLADLADDIEFSCTHCGHQQDLPEPGTQNR